MINKDMSIADAIKTKPSILQILSDSNIDYCCGGNRPLIEAIAERNLDIDSFIELLNKHEVKTESTIEDVLKLSKEDLTDYIVDVHHKKEKELLNTIDTNLQTLLRVHYDSHGKELTELFDLFMRIKKDLYPHFIKEERDEFVVFRNTGNINVEELVAEHEAVGELIHELERITDKFTPPADACNTYRYTYALLKELSEDVQLHVFIENSILFI